MNILINGQNVFFEVSEERTLSDIVKSVSEWAKDRDLIFSEFFVDGIYCTIDNFKEMSIEGISEINCIIQSTSDIIFSTLTEAISYCDRVLMHVNESIDNGKFNMRELGPFHEGITWMTDITMKVFSLLNLNPSDVKHMDYTITEYIKKLKGLSEALKNSHGETDILLLLQKEKDIFTAFKNIYKIALLSDNLRKIIIRSIDSPDLIVSSLKDIKEKIDDQMQNIQNAAEEFQSGKDESASEKLQGFVDFIYQYIRTSYQSLPVFSIDSDEISIDGISITEKNNNITAFLAQIVEVMENKDIVALSDILEYEIRPNIENIPQYVDLILDKIK